MNNRSLLRDTWKERINDYLASGLTQRDWCNQHHIKLHQFHYWLKKDRNHNKQDVSTKWVKAEIETKASSYDTVSIYINDIELRVNKNFNKELLLEVVKVLKSYD